MKNIKKVLALFTIVLLMTSCFKRDDLEDVDIYTTVYPIEFVTNFLYGYNSDVSSIYPAETNPEEYKLTKKQIEDYSKGAIFIYNGLTNEKSIARDLLNENKNLRIIDVSQGLEYSHKVEELWLNPSDFLMLAQNIKTGLEEYISNKYIIEEIDKNYEDLKVLISSYDVELTKVQDNTDDKNMIIASNALSFLKKYGLNLTNIDETNGDLSIATKKKAKKLVTDKKVKYIYMLDTDEKSDFVKELESAGAEVKALRSMTILTEEEVKNGVTYKTMMRDNIEEIKREVYE